MLYFKGIVKAIIPRRPHEIVTVAVLASLMSWFGYQIFLQSPPSVVVFAETQYPKSVPRGGVISLNFDLAFDRNCTINARRFIIASDGVEYLAQEDSKDVIAGERIAYTVKVPVSETIPIGPALVRSQFIYQCDIWSTWVKRLERGGQARRVFITELGTFPTRLESGSGLEPKAGFTVVRSYYRRKAGLLASNDP